MAKELKAFAPWVPEEDLFAATPPAAALNFLLSLLVSKKSRARRHFKLASLTVVEFYCVRVLTSFQRLVEPPMLMRSLAVLLIARASALAPAVTSWPKLLRCPLRTAPTARLRSRRSPRKPPPRRRVGPCQSAPPFNSTDC